MGERSRELVETHKHTPAGQRKIFHFTHSAPRDLNLDQGAVFGLG